MAGLSRVANPALALSGTCPHVRRDEQSLAEGPGVPDGQLQYRTDFGGPNLSSQDGTKKFVLTLADGNQVECVLIPDEDRLTLCLSTQVGCTLDCGFCLTGTLGLQRNLRAHEILDQVLLAQDHLQEGHRLTNLVFMGMGEPLANLDAVADAVTRLTNNTWGLGFSGRRITISTAGLASRIKDVAPSR